MRLCSRLYSERCSETLRLTAEVEHGISDLQFTAAYRVPFQYSRFVRDAPDSRSLCRFVVRASR